jgi:hypothetical protein
MYYVVDYTNNYTQLKRRKSYHSGIPPPSKMISQVFFNFHLKQVWRHLSEYMS